MAFDITHKFVSLRFTPTRVQAGAETFFRVDERGSFELLTPGRLDRAAHASFRHTIKFPNVTVPNPTLPTPIDGLPGGGLGGPGGPPGGGPGVPSNPKPFEITEIAIPLTLRIFDPAGREFTAGEVTLAELRKHRNLRGTPAGLWTYRLSGESQRFKLAGGPEQSVGEEQGKLDIIVREVVPSESARPLVPSTVLQGPRAFSFDLFRIGMFEARIAPSVLPWRGSMRLIDPDGVEVARSTTRTLRFSVGLATLNKSRDDAGRARPWSLQVTPAGGQPLGSPRVSATVIGTIRVNGAVIKRRIDQMIGERGKFLELFGDNKGGRARARLRIKDAVAAETLDMHHLLEDAIKANPQDPGVDPKDLKAGTTYTIATKSEDQGSGAKLHVGQMKVDAVDVTIGPGIQLGANTPTIRLSVKVLGEGEIKLGPVKVAELEVRGSRLEIEVGLRLASDGTPEIVTAIRDDPLDLDIDEGALGVLFLFPPALIAFKAKLESDESDENASIAGGVRKLFSAPDFASRTLMMIVGAHVTYRAIRVDGDDFVLEYIAPLEPDPRPTKGYTGVVGRTLTQLGPQATLLQPRTLGDTWAADNLNKIEHIVVVMMENRSYDHVLGYRAQASGSRPADGADGLTAELIDDIQSVDGHRVRRLRDAGFAANSIGLKTRIPKDLGHGLRDVAEQLSAQTAGPGDRSINSPRGFVSNFEKRLRSDPKGLVKDDCLGFYDERDLPFYAFLADHYAYCDRYYCSHPGPTLPNRMYSLSGDVQYDRYGIPILDNNNSDNFLLSRAPTIYDLLTRHGVAWRVYESEPSVTMLRMFARYATNDTDIVPFEQRFEADAAAGNLPAFSVVEPSLHHHPQNDDHPPADMYQGQIFLRRVYQALRKGPKWEKTLLIITYDEHGGLYDHVVPPIADFLKEPPSRVADRAAVDAIGRTPDKPAARRTLGASGLAGTAGTARGLSAAAAGTVAGTTPRRGSAALGAISVDLDTLLPTGFELATVNPKAPLSIPYGVRVPTFVISPWTTRGKGPSLTLDHCSLIKTVLARFLGAKKPFLSDRVAASQSFNAFLSEAQPRTDVPDPPRLRTPTPDRARAFRSGRSKIDTPTLSRKEMRQGSVDYHALSGRLARMLGR